MDWLLLSLHSIGVIATGILALAMFFFLLFKKDKTRPTLLLSGFIFGISVLALGYSMSYTVFAPWGAFHRLLTVAILFGIAFQVAFAYRFPRPDRPREARVIVILSVLIALAGWIDFFYKTFRMEPHYDFDAHFFTLDYGDETSRYIALVIVIAIQIMVRKTIRYSGYSGRFSPWLETPASKFSAAGVKHLVGRFCVGWIKIVLPEGRDAKATRAFTLAFIGQIVIGALNLLNKSDRLTYDEYAIWFSVLSILTYWAIFMTYMNNSPEPTTFMVKLVGISMVSLVLVFAGVSYFTLFRNEAAYDRQRVTEVINARDAILAADTAKMPPEIEYVLAKSVAGGRTAPDMRLHFSRAPERTVNDFLNGGQRESFVHHKHKVIKLKKADKTLSDAEADAQARALLNAHPKPLTRSYRIGDQFYTTFDFEDEGTRYEVGYSYRAYRQYVHEVAGILFLLVMGSSVAMVIVFPLLFQGSLVRPLNDLLSGVGEVNQGNLDVKVPIKIMDEIGFLSQAFNGMVSSIKQAKERLIDYAENLEHKVEARTREVREKMEEVQRLKVQQDGDYFLTSLLAKPLFFNANKSRNVRTQFIIRQKKRFEFRSRQADLGGDICVTGNLKFGTPDNFQRFTMAVNADAMGKSMQGAGGSLVLGVVMNSIMARSASQKRVLNSTPEEWLREVYDETHSVFKTFDGSMVISATIFLVNDETGECWYWNAEHPFGVLYRNGKASFIEEGLKLRKLGLDSEFEFEICKFQLAPGDVVILGSDGRDDINLTPDEPYRTINEDEYLFLKHVERGRGNLELIERAIARHGEMTDDLSLLRISYKVPLEQETGTNGNLTKIADTLYKQGKKLYKEGDGEKALQALTQAFELNPEDPNLNKLLGILSFRGKDYRTAVEVLSIYLKQDPEAAQFWYYLSIAQKALGNYPEALVAAETLEELEPDNLNNLVNLSDLNRLLGRYNNARLYSEQAEKLDPENKHVQKMKSILIDSVRA